MIFELFSNNDGGSGTGGGGSQKVCRGNFEIGNIISNAILHVLQKHKISLSDISVIASHGQTIWHEIIPSSGRCHSTLQIGEAAVISHNTGITCVEDFRVADVSAGGQGAPVTSIFDYMILRPHDGDKKKWRAVQNIGGIGNVTFLPPHGVQHLPIAFDTGPGNVLIDWWTSRITDNEKKYDEGGDIARQGTINQKFLSLMLSHPYFSMKPPKTTGRELFSFKQGEMWIKEAQELGILSSSKSTTEDQNILATFTELTAVSIAQSYKLFMPSSDICDGLSEVIIGGGGGKNTYLMERIRYNLSVQFSKESSTEAATKDNNIKIFAHEDVGIDSKAKEALVFALLGWMCVNGIEASSLPACTGAASSKILGKIVPGSNYRKLMKEINFDRSESVV
eukprot:TRINITY_DN2746_c0_g1_i1.p1 TRINITY_DN2746_c0_g1~~TRINITY_DN2746_c0_g1_i1.p1  ORF type:complete len:394 (+),score=66.88 TRINITY_DN2746_c0_g1_i1:184-1365(+)